MQSVLPKQGALAHRVSVCFATNKRVGAKNLRSPNRECYVKRPPGCKDLIDVIRTQQHAAPTRLPPIIQRVTLPEVVAVRYMAELLQLSKDEVSALCGYFGERSVPFDQAQKILRKYGIWADKAA